MGLITSSCIKMSLIGLLCKRSLIPLFLEKLIKHNYVLEFSPENLYFEYQAPTD